MQVARWVFENWQDLLVALLILKLVIWFLIDNSSMKSIALSLWRQNRLKVLEFTIENGNEIQKISAKDEYLKLFGK